MMIRAALLMGIKVACTALNAHHAKVLRSLLVDWVVVQIKTGNTALTPGDKEARLLIEKMRLGEVVPKLSPEECMEVMFEVLSDSRKHELAAEGFKKVGQSIDLHGREDALVCREAGIFWNEETTDHYPNMRAKIDAELAAVAEEWEAGRLTWNHRVVRRLIAPYPVNKQVDRVLAKLGEDFGCDGLEELGGEVPGVIVPH